jgi:hypothetical protein
MEEGQGNCIYECRWESWKRTTTTGLFSADIGNGTAIVSPGLKVPFGAREVMDLKRPFGEYFGI